MRDELFVDICRNEYRAVLQMLREAIRLCPRALWAEQAEEPPFWQQAYHALWALDFYLSKSPEAFEKASFVPAEATDLRATPPVAPTKVRVQAYLDQVSAKAEAGLDGLTGAALEAKNTFPWTGPTMAHRLVYNVRHAQHHVGRLNSMLSRKAGRAAGWRIRGSRIGTRKTATR